MSKRKEYKPRRLAKYVKEYRTLTNDFEKKYNCKVSINLLYRIHRDWLIKDLDTDFEESRKNRPIYYDSILNDAYWHFDEFKKLGYSVDDVSKLSGFWKSIQDCHTAFMLVKSQMQIRENKYIELIEQFGAINNDDVPVESEHYKSVKILSFETLVNAAQDYDFLRSLLKSHKILGLTIQDILSDFNQQLDSLLRIHKHILNDVSEDVTLIIDKDRIPIGESLAIKFYYNLKKDVFELLEPYFNYFSIKTELAKIEFTQYCSKMISFWIKNPDLIVKSPFQGYNSWFPSDFQIYKQQKEFVTSKNIIVLMYDFLLSAFPDEISDLKIYFKDINDSGLKNYLTINPNTNRREVEGYMYEKMRDEVEKFLKPIM